MGDALDAVPAELMACSTTSSSSSRTSRPADDPDLLGVYDGDAAHRARRAGPPARSPTGSRSSAGRCGCARTGEDLLDEIAVTVVHEIAHHFGIDDARLHELGWG